MKRKEGATGEKTICSPFCILLLQRWRNRRGRRRGRGEKWGAKKGVGGGEGKRGDDTGPV